MIPRNTEWQEEKLTGSKRNGYGHAITLGNIPEHRTCLAVTQEVASSSLVGPANFFSDIQPSCMARWSDVRKVVRKGPAITSPFVAIPGI